MTKPDLHIIAFAVPYPATYGGAIDVWNRVKALHRNGVKVCLHCFVYGPFGPHDALREVTTEVHYHPRISWPAILSPGQPYIVSSRKNPLLLNRLSQDDVPVLFEGIHTTGFLEELTGRKKMLRSHNIEHQYYNELAKDSQRFQYLFFQRESLALQRYEMKNAKEFDMVFPISVDDTQWYEQKGASCEYVPVFHGCEDIDIIPGKGDYMLYQGDLSIESNQKALNDLLKNLPTASSMPLVVAGKSGEKIFEEKLTKYANLRREADVSENRMLELIRDAQVTIIHSRHSSGMKVKIFPALFHGRFVVANENSLTKTDLDKGLQVYSTWDQLGDLLKKLRSKEFTHSDIEERKSILASCPSDDEKAKQIMRYL